MSAASQYLQKKLLDHLLVNTAYTPETNLYVGLFTADPGESGVTGEFTIGVGAYARAVIANNVTNFPPCSLTGTPTKTNGTLIAFPTATTIWGVATHWAIYSASSAGNMIAHGPLAASYTIQIGNTPKIAIGGISLTFPSGANGGVTDYAKRKLLDLTFGASTFTPPASVYLGVGTALTGETLSEWTETTYLRPLAAFTAATLGTGTCPNTDAETFASSIADAGPFSLTHYGIWDDQTAGNLLVVGAVNSSKTVNTGDSASLAAGSCIATFA